MTYAFDSASIILPVVNETYSLVETVELDSPKLRSRMCGSY